MTANNPNLDLVNINASVKFDEICQFVLKILSGNKILRISRALEEMCKK